MGANNKAPKAKPANVTKVLTPAEHVAALVNLGVELEWFESHISHYYNNYLAKQTPEANESTEGK